MSALGSLVVKLALEHAEFTKGIDKTSYAAQKFAKNTQEEMRKVEASLKNTAAGFAKLGAAYLAVNFSVNNIVQMADEYTKLTAQLRNSTTTQIEYEQAMQNTARIAQLVQADVGAVGAVYARLSNALRDIGATQNEVNDITKTLALSLRVNGASSAEAASVMLQLSQAFGSGKLAGDEFRTAMEGAPNLMRELARSMNVPVGSLKDLAAEGKITSQVLLDAFTNKEFIIRLEKQNEKIKTVEGGFTNLKNAVLAAIGEIDQKMGASKFFSDALGGLAGTINPKYAPKNSAIDTLNKLAALGRQFALNSVGIKTTAQEQVEQARKDAIAKAGIFGGTNPITYNAPVAPNFNQGYVVRDVNKVHQAQEERARKTAKLNGEVKSAYDSLITSIKKKIDTQALEITMTEPLSEAQKLLIDINSEIASGQLKVNAAQKANIDSLINKLALGETEIAQLNAQKIAQENYYKLIDDAANKRKDEAQSLVEKADAQDLELRMLTMSRAELQALEQARYDEQIAILESQKAYLAGNEDRAYEVELIEKQIEALGRLRNNVGKSDALQETQRAKDDFFNSMEAQAHRVWSIFANEGGQSFKAIGQSLKAYVLDMLYQLTLKKFFVNIGVGFGATGSAAAMAQGNGVIGTGSWLDTLTNGFKSINTTFASSIENLGAFLSNGNGGLADKIGGFMGQYSNQIASGLSYASSLYMLSQKNYAGAALSAVGTYFGGPIGGAIGGAIGGMLGGSLFGGRVSTKKYSTGATTSYADGKLINSSALSGLAGYGRSLGGSDALTSLGEQYSKVMGSLFKAFDLSDEITTSASIFQRSSKKTRSWGYWGASFGSGGGASISTGHQGTAQNTLNALIEMVMTTGITQGIRNSNLPEAIKDLFNDITDKTQIGNMVNSTLALAKSNQALIDSFNITAEKTAKVALQSGLTGDELGAVLNQLIAFGNEARTIGDSLTELRIDLKDAFGDTFYSSLKDFDNALKVIDKTTEEGIESFYKLISLRADFSKYQSSIDSLKGGVKSSILGYLSDSERQAMLNADLAEMFASVNVQMPATIDELVALGKSIDYTTKEGINLASVFPSLIDAFVKTKNVVAELTKTADNFATLVDFNRYKGIASNYGVSFANSYIPSYDVGTNYVPNDGLAMIHKGERIIPAKDNAVLMQDSAHMVGELRAMRAELANVHYALQSVGVNTGKTAKSLERMENEGIIISDIGLDGNDQIVKVEVV